MIKFLKYLYEIELCFRKILGKYYKFGENFEKILIKFDKYIEMS